MYATATGGRLRAADGHRASVARPRADGRDDVIEAPLITFGVDGDERSLTAVGGVNAVVWALPQAATASPKKGARRTIAVTSGSRIEFDGKTAAGGKTAQISVRAHDGAAVESREAGVTADRVAAHELTALLVERTGPRGPDLLGSPRTPSLPAAAGPKPSRPRGPTAGTRTAAQAARWAVTCQTLDVRFASETGTASALGGLRRLDAQGQVDASSNGGGGPLDRQHFEGARLLVDGTTGRGVLTAASATARARVSLGDETLPQRLVSPKVDFVLSEGALSGATFHAPVAGVFHDAGSLTGPERPAGAKAASGEVERFLLQSDLGDLVIDAKGAIVQGTDDRPVVVTRSTRAKGATTFVEGPQARLAQADARHRGRPRRGPDVARSDARRGREHAGGAGRRDEGAHDRRGHPPRVRAGDVPRAPDRHGRRPRLQARVPWDGAGHRVRRTDQLARHRGPRRHPGALEVTPLAFLDIGFSEMVVVAFVALLLFGGRLPEVMRTLGASYRSLRKGVDELSRSAMRPDLSIPRYQPTTRPIPGPKTTVEQPPPPPTSPPAAPPPALVAGPLPLPPLPDDLPPV